MAWGYLKLGWLGSKRQRGVAGWEQSALRTWIRNAAREHCSHRGPTWTTFGTKVLKGSSVVSGRFLPGLGSISGCAGLSKTASLLVTVLSWKSSSLRETSHDPKLVQENKLLTRRIEEYTGLGRVGAKEAAAT